VSIGRGSRLGAAACFALLALGFAAPAAGAAESRYSVVNGCYGLRSVSLGKVVAGPFRMQATTLGQYLLYGKDRDFLVVTSGGAVGRATEPSTDAEWRLDEAGGGSFRIFSLAAEKVLVAGADGALALGDPGPSALFAFEKAEGCAVYPELETNTTGNPRAAPLHYGETKGFIDTHLHGMAFEFIGGRIHCGRPWHPYGPQVALLDCPDHEPDGVGAAGENVVSYGNPVGTHDTDGWPTFVGWPHHDSLTHEQTYWKWMERAWRGGLRLYVNLFVDNRVLCEVYPYRRNPCDEMANVKLQVEDLREFERFIDAQSGGPGKGWLRIVSDPFEARRIINQGKLAVVPGIEVSRLFNCGETNDVPQCTREQVDQRLDEAYKMGVRQMELLNKFDNAFAGVAGDSGSTGAVTNAGNKYETGHFLGMQTCTGPNAEHDHDKTQPTVPEADRDPLFGNILKAFTQPGDTPVYPAGPHCNVRGLTALGAYLVRRMVEKKMIFDPDHMSVVARDQALAIIEANDYSGVISSHSWSTPDSYRRILRMGGVVTPAEKNSADHVKAWQELRKEFDPRFYRGLGFSTDMNGFAHQGGTRENVKEKPLVYPFKSFDGAVTLDKQKSGEKVFDLNVDGTAHFGLYPDRMEDIRVVGGQEVFDDLVRSAENYLQMWERAEGVPGPDCRSARRRFTPRRLSGIQIGLTPEALLRAAGQPQSRPGRVWTYCAKGTGSRAGEIKAVFTPEGRVGLVASNAAVHRALGRSPGDPVSRLSRKAKGFGPGLRVRPAGGGRRYVYGVQKGRITFVALASRTAGRTPAALRTYVRLSGGAKR
jgi:hypothetical protein